LNKIRKKRLADEVINEITKLIQNGELKEGDMLPSQSEFAAQLGVSRPSLREALNTLASLGVIELRPGLGTFLRSNYSSLYIDYLNVPLISNPKVTNELLEVREFLEVGAAGLAAKNATDNEIEQMRVLVEEMDKALYKKRMDEATDRDLDFHMLISDASRNGMLKSILMNIRSTIKEFMYETNMVVDFSAYQKDHRALYHAIKNRDEMKAKAQMKKHIINLRSEVNLYYELKKPQLEGSVPKEYMKKKI